MGFSNNYEADTHGLDGTDEFVGGLVGKPKRLLTRFDDTVQNNALWKGEDDDFQKEMAKREKQQNESCREVLGSLDAFFVGLQSALRQSRGSIEGVQQEAKDKIHEGQSNGDNYGGGKH